MSDKISSPVNNYKKITFYFFNVVVCGVLLIHSLGVLDKTFLTDE